MCPKFVDTISFRVRVRVSRVSSQQQQSEKFEMDLGRLAPASEVAEGHTLPF
jgi:hypothetical protein